MIIRGAWSPRPWNVVLGQPDLEPNMPGRSARILVWILVPIAALVAAGGWWLRRHDQTADPSFSASVARPAYPFTAGVVHPHVAVDDAHHEFHTLPGRYAPFARLLLADGFEVTASHAPFSAAGLKGVDVLVIANAMGASLPVLPGARHSPFTEAEMDSLREWVRGGGSLLLVSDHEPMGDANRALAARFGVDMRSARTVDFVRYDSVSGSPAWIVFERAHGEIGDHPITQGRDSTERIDRVVGYAGQSLAAPAGATALLILGDSAFDRMPNGEFTPAKGRAMAVAMEFGKGRVVVVGEAAMLTAQVTNAGALRFGFQLPGTQDQQFVLNVARWLARSGARDAAR